MKCGPMTTPDCAPHSALKVTNKNGDEEIHCIGDAALTTLCGSLTNAELTTVLDVEECGCKAGFWTEFVDASIT
jgi:hypothetical protein